MCACLSPLPRGVRQVHWKDDEDAAPGAEEAYPYVSFTLNMQ